MDFNFSGLADIQKPSNNNYLQPWGVYDMVEFDGVSDPVTGKTSEGGTWKAWDFKFKCPDGTYSERIFEPDAQGVQRRKVKNSNGHESELPSDFERSQLVVMQILDAYNPKGADALRKNASKIKTFEQFIELAKKALASAAKPTKEHNIQLKLNGRTTQDGKTYARLPNANLGKEDGKPWMGKFIGENITMSAWETQQRDKYKSAKPSNPEKVNPIQAEVDGTVDNKNGEEISDFDGLLR